MKNALAQVCSAPGNIEENIDRHLYWIKKANEVNAHLIVFPELSLTGYEPKAANALAIGLDDPRLSVFQRLSNKSQITISIGAPVKGITGTHIGQLIFQPNHSLIHYAKQILHADEKPYFVTGTKQIIIDQGYFKIAPAICYESLQATHLQNAIASNTNFYLASVAKDTPGIQKARSYFEHAAKYHSIPIAMVNGVGSCSDFQLAGGTSFWNRQSKLLGQLNATEEGFLMVDLNSEEVSAVHV